MVAKMAEPGQENRNPCPKLVEPDQIREMIAILKKFRKISVLKLEVMLFHYLLANVPVSIPLLG